MSYEIDLKMLVKTMGIKYTELEMYSIISEAILKVDSFRDVDIYEFKSDYDNINKETRSWNQVDVPKCEKCGFSTCYFLDANNHRICTLCIDKEATDE